ncbi:MAG: hypothetical protein GY830_07340 [Bacteroidetes bacterium]|nr:hypothetical protein [Bacteroidota bacterium]
MKILKKLLFIKFVIFNLNFTKASFDNLRISSEFTIGLKDIFSTGQGSNNHNFKSNFASIKTNTHYDLKFLLGYDLFKVPFDKITEGFLGLDIGLKISNANEFKNITDNYIFKERTIDIPLFTSFGIKYEYPKLPLKVSIFIGGAAKVWPTYKKL